MADIVYRYYDGVYLNITNQCPCNCAFCIRSKGDAVGDAKEMWFDTEPTWEEIKAAIDAYDFAHTDEAVFCGYGEPTNALDHLLQAADYLRTVNPKIHLRLNTNGLSDLINGKPTAELLCRHFDSSFSVTCFSELKIRNTFCIDPSLENSRINKTRINLFLFFRKTERFLSKRDTLH